MKKVVNFGPFSDFPALYRKYGKSYEKVFNTKKLADGKIKPIEKVWLKYFDK